MARWYCLIDGKQRGDFSEDELKARILRGDVTRETLVKPFSEQDGGVEDGDWKKAGDTELVKLFASGDSGTPQAAAAPKAGEEAARTPVPLQHNYFAWGMVGAVILTLLLPDVEIDSIGYLVMVFGMGFLNFLLAHFDAKMIEKAGYGRMKWGAAICVLLPPVYLYMRASKSKQKPLQLYAWLAIFCLMAGIAMLGSLSDADLEETARQLVSEINFRRTSPVLEAAKCTRVEITGRISDRMSRAKAYLDNGFVYNITITEEGDQVQVEILPFF